MAVCIQPYYWEGPSNDIFCPRLFTCVGCLFVVGCGVRVLLWIWLWELSWSAILISAGLWSKATSSKSTLISAPAGRLHSNRSAGAFLRSPGGGGIITDSWTLFAFALFNFNEARVAWKTISKINIVIWRQAFVWQCVRELRELWWIKLNYN